MRAIAVIGAAFGDCGKGRTVDAILSRVSPESAIVVRHNSSAQAGHTVVLDGRRHVFSHFGSGTLRGVASHLGWDFVVNPRIFAEELGQLLAMHIDPMLTCSPGCLITTPYDTAANQIMELARGDARHGSCGVGFGQTIYRSLIRPSLNLRTGALLGDIPTLLREIRRFYLRNLPNLSEIDHPAAQFMRDDDADLKPWLDALALFKSLVRICPASDYSKRETIVFEGAQGLMLDQDHPRYFPHVTRCSTGLRDAVTCAKSMLLHSIEAMYVMRPYLTRHGAGPLPYEVDAAPVDKFEDATNQPNPWQGTLRFGLLDVDEMISTINADIEWSKSMIHIKPMLTMTCLDQLRPDQSIDVVRGGIVGYREDVGDVMQDIGRGIGADLVFGTYGPSAGGEVAGGPVKG